MCKSCEPIFNDSLHLLTKRTCMQPFSLSDLSIGIQTVPMLEYMHSFTYQYLNNEIKDDCS